VKIVNFDEAIIKNQKQMKKISKQHLLSWWIEVRRS